MPKIPRDVSGRELAKLLGRHGYEITRQTGNHIRLTSRHRGIEHHVTIPAHPSLKIGTINHILKDIAEHLKCDKEFLIKELFGD